MLAVLNIALYIAMGATIISIVLCGLRLWKGPSAQDRILALDTMWMCGMLLVLLMGMLFGSEIYFEFAMLVALTGFVSTIALAKFLIRGEIIE